ncbi:MAG: ABC transporter permease [Chloroflexia bacterium]|jgi:peptide/nickel transport system permease protein|nr:ABC transporter permease [Chloroflexia bacterium]
MAVTAGSLAGAIERRSRWTQLRLTVGRNRNVLVGGSLLLLIVAVAVLASVLMTHDPSFQDPGERLLAPSGDYLLGTDGSGRDVFSRVVKGAQLSLLVGIGVATATSIIGGFIGLITGFVPRVDAPVMRVMDGLMAFPGIILAIGIMAVRGAEISNVILALTVVNTPRMARVVRSVVLGLANTQFVEAAESSGCTLWRILGVHLLPNTLSPLIVQASFVFAEAVLGEATLSFLGAGAPPSVPSWGGMLSESRLFLSQASWTMIAPGAALTFTVFALNLLGDGLRDMFDPRLRHR